jgi:hypothetical protein
MRSLRNLILGSVRSSSNGASNPVNNVNNLNIYPQTLMINNLPRNSIGLPNGAVWADENGILRIVI